jgi:hypothetical protein
MDTGGRGSFFRANDSHGVRLPSRYVHLTDTETHQQNQDSQRKIRHQRHKNQQNVRREVRDNHGVDKAEARSKA